MSKGLSFMRAPVLAATMSIGLLGAASPALAQQADGSALFRQRCQMCHVTTPGQKATMGPNLAGVVGRKAGSTDFLYSAPLKASNLQWDKATLDKFLTAPSKLVPGTRMVISVANPADRTALVAYLASLKK